MKAPAAILFAVLPLALAAVPAAALDADKQSAPTRRQPASKPPDLRHSAISALIAANGGYIPASGVELTRALAKLGRPVQLPFPFSSVALDSGLGHPRVVLTLRPTPTKEVIPFTPFGGWGGSGSSSGPDQIISTPIPTQAANAPRLEGRLFLAANMDAGASGAYARVKTIEFISWNSRRLKFDFGVIEGMGGEPELRLVDGGRCFSCHKNHGPILGVGPWSNSSHNDIVRAASTPLFTLVAHPVPAPKPIDGMDVLSPSAPEVESAVRAGASLLRDREIIRAMTKTREGRRALIMLLRAIVEPGSLDQIERRVRFDLGGFGLAPFIADAVTIQKITPSDFLSDFGPSGSVGQVTGNKITWGGTVEGVTAYDTRRAAGRTPLPPEHVPSNPRAFLTPPVNASPNPADHVSAVKLARTLGLTEGDRKFMADTLREVAGWANDSAVTPGRLALDVFTGPEFEDVLAGGPLPDRDEFKDRFIAGILATRVAGPIYWADRRDYAGSPKVDRGANDQEVAPPTPTSACLGCHEVSRTGKQSGFSPIPALQFDPFDAAARGSWVRTTDRKRRAEVLARLLQRLGTDKDMPPEDAPEAALRERDPAAFTAVVAWLEMELKRANGR